MDSDSDSSLDNRYENHEHFDASDDSFAPSRDSGYGSTIGTPGNGFPPPMPNVHGHLLYDAIVKLQTRRSNFKRFVYQILMFVLIVAIFAFMIYPCAIWIQIREMRYAASQNSDIRDSSDELKIYRSTFTNKLCDILEYENETNVTTIEIINQNLKEFLEIYYNQRYKKFGGILEALDFNLIQSDLYAPWNRGTIIEALLNVMTLTGSDTFLFNTSSGRILMLIIAAVGFLLLTIVLASSASLTVSAVKKCLRLLCFCKTKKGEKDYGTNNSGANFGIHFGTLIIVTVCCIGSIVLGIIAIKNDQPKWSFKDASFYVFSEVTTLGTSRFVPELTAKNKQTGYSIFFYTIIKLFIMYWLTCFFLAIFEFSKILKRTFPSGSSTSRDIHGALAVDRERMMHQHQNVNYLD